MGARTPRRVTGSGSRRTGATGGARTPRRVTGSGGGERVTIGWARAPRRVTGSGAGEPVTILGARTPRGVTGSDGGPASVDSPADGHARRDRQPDQPRGAGVGAPAAPGGDVGTPVRPVLRRPAPLRPRRRPGRQHRHRQRRRAVRDPGPDPAYHQPDALPRRPDRQGVRLLRPAPGRPGVAAGRHHRRRGRPHAGGGDGGGAVHPRPVEGLPAGRADPGGGTVGRAGARATWSGSTSRSSTASPA